jgi:hypothetical protein
MVAVREISTPLAASHLARWREISEAIEHDGEFKT